MNTLEHTPAENTASSLEVTDQFNDQMSQEFSDMPGLFEASSIPEVDRITSKYINEIKRHGSAAAQHEAPTLTPSPEITDSEDTAEVSERKKFSLRRMLGRFSLSRLNADMMITQMNVTDAIKSKNDTLKARHEAHEDDNRRTRVRKWLGRHSLKLAAGGLAGLGGLVYAGARMKYGVETGGTGTAHIDVATTAVSKPLDPNAPVDPIYVGGHTQGQSNVMPNAARQSGVSSHSGAPRVARYNAELGGIIPGEGQTMRQSGEQAKTAILAQAKTGDTVFAHSEGTLGALEAAKVKPDLKVIAVGSPYAPGSGLLAGNSPANSKTVGGVLNTLGVPTGNQGPANAHNVTYLVNDGGAAHGGRGTGDVWSSTVDPDGTINPMRALSNGLGTAYLGTHELGAHSGTPYAITKNPDGSITKHFNSGTGVTNPTTGKAYESGVTATLQKNNGITTPANIDHALKLAEGDSNGNVNARAVGEAVAPGLGNVTAPFQGLADAIKPVERAIANPTPATINTAINSVTQGLGTAAPAAKPQGGGGNIVAQVTAHVNTPAAPKAAPAAPNIPSPQQFQADPVGTVVNTGMGILGGLLGGAPR